MSAGQNRIYAFLTILLLLAFFISCSGNKPIEGKFISDEEWGGERWFVSFEYNNDLDEYTVSFSSDGGVQERIAPKKERDIYSFVEGPDTYIFKIISEDEVYLLDQYHTDSVEPELKYYREK